MATSVDPDQTEQNISHSAMSDLDLHCLHTSLKWLSTVNMNDIFFFYFLV